MKIEKYQILIHHGIQSGEHMIGSGFILSELHGRFMYITVHSFFFSGIITAGYWIIKKISKCEEGKSLHVYLLQNPVTFR